MHKTILVILACLVMLSGCIESPLTGASVTAERLSSQGMVGVDKISVYENQIVLAIPNATITRFTNTKSMDPTFDHGANGIEVPPIPGELEVGDIISYYPKSGQGVVVHRIVEVGVDEQGEYYIVQGDNNPIPDEERVRFEQVAGVVIGILY